MIKGLLSLSGGQTVEASLHLAEAVELLEVWGSPNRVRSRLLPDAIEASARSGDIERAESWLDSAGRPGRGPRRRMGAGRGRSEPRL